MILGSLKINVGWLFTLQCGKESMEQLQSMKSEGDALLDASSESKG